MDSEHHDAVRGFHFKQTGARFRRGERINQIARKDQMSQAAKARIDYRLAGK